MIALSGYDRYSGVFPVYQFEWVVLDHKCVRKSDFRTAAPLIFLALLNLVAVLPKKEMRQVALNKAGDFTHWESKKLEALLSDNYPSGFGRLIAANDYRRIWALELNPMETLSFRLQPQRYTWFTKRGGVATIAHDDGKISLLAFGKNDFGFVDNGADDRISELKNIGPSMLRLLIYDYLQPMVLS